MDPLSPRTLLRLRQALVAGLSVWAVVYLRADDAFGLLDSVDLPIHETGHLVFAPFGEFVGALGGTLLQLLFPLAFVVHFGRRGDRYAAYVVLGWVAQNLWNVARYVADARAQELPLVGGGEHDWAYLLGRMGLLAHDTAIAGGVRMLGVVVFTFAMIQALHHAAVEPKGAEVADGSLLPPWIEHPEIPPFSTLWRMGYGEDYMHEWARWYAGLDARAKHGYQARYPEPDGWRGFYHGDPAG